MSRVSVTARTFIVGLLGSLLLAAPARADLITINFTGSVNLTSEGGAVYPYSGFFTWNTTASPHETEPGMAGYPLANYNLIFNGVNVTIPVSPDGNGNDLDRHRRS